MFSADELEDGARAATGLHDFGSPYYREGLERTVDALNTEAELSEMSDADAAEFLSSYGLKESGLTRLIRKTYELLGLISFFTAGEDECRAWQIPANTRAQEAVLRKLLKLLLELSLATANDRREHHHALALWHRENAVDNLFDRLARYLRAADLAVRLADRREEKSKVVVNFRDRADRRARAARDSLLLD